MKVGDLAELYYGHMIVGAPTETGEFNILYDTREHDGDVPFDICFMEVFGIFPREENLLEVCVS